MKNFIPSQRCLFVTSKSVLRSLDDALDSWMQLPQQSCVFTNLALEHVFGMMDANKLACMVNAGRRPPRLPRWTIK